MEQTINLNVTGITYFRNQLTKIPSKVLTQTATGSGSTPRNAQAAAREAAFNAVCNAILGWTPSYSYVTSGFGSYNTTEGSNIGVSYHRTSVDGVVVTNNTATLGIKDSSPGIYVSTGTATGTGEGQKVWRNTYSTLIKLSLGDGVRPTSGAITKALIKLTPTSITGNPSNYTWRLAIANNGSIPSTFIRPDTIQNSDYTYKDFQFSSSSGTTEIEITKLVQKMIEKNSYYLYLCCVNIPSSNTSFSLATNKITLSANYKLSPVVTNGELSGDNIVESQNKILTPYQQFTLSWEAASNGLGTTVSGYELYYMDANNNKQIIGTYDVSKLSVELKPDKEGNINPYLPPRGSTRTFYLRALANYSAADLQGAPKSYSITTNSLPTAPSFSLSAGYYKNSEGEWVLNETIYGEDIQNNKKYYWFKSGDDVYSYDLNFSSPLSNDKDSGSGQNISYTYKIDGNIVEINDQTFSNDAYKNLPVGTSSTERWQKIYKITATDTLGESSSTELVIYRSLPITITKSDLSAPYQDVAGNDYWIYFSDTPLITGGYENKYIKTLKLNNTVLEGITEINNILILREDVKNFATLELTVTDGVDTTSCTYNFNVPVAASFDMLNASNENLIGVNPNYFGNFIAFKTQGSNVDRGVTITTTIGEAKFSFSKQPSSNPTHQYCEPSVKELARNKSHTFIIEQRWGDYAYITEMSYFRCIGEQQLLSGLAMYQSGVFYPLLLKENNNYISPESFGIVDSDGITAPIGLVNSSPIKFIDLVNNKDFSEAAALSQDVSQVLEIKIRQKDNPKEKSLSLIPNVEGARINLVDQGNEFFQFVTWSNPDGISNYDGNLVNWLTYFDIKDAKPISAVATVTVTNLFGEVFSKDLDFKISFQADFLNAEHTDISVKTTNAQNSFQSITAAATPFPAFESEIFKFDFSVTSFYQQNIVAHVKFAGREIAKTLSLKQTESSLVNGTTIYEDSVEFLIPKITQAQWSVVPEIWLTAPSLLESTKMMLSSLKTFNLRRTDLEASNLAIVDVLAENLQELGAYENFALGEENADAFRYTVALKGSDFGGTPESANSNNSYYSDGFKDNPKYKIYFSTTNNFSDLDSLLIGTINVVPYTESIDGVILPKLDYIFATNVLVEEGQIVPSEIVQIFGDNNTKVGLLKTSRQGYIKIVYEVENNFEKGTNLNLEESFNIDGTRIYSKDLGVLTVFSLMPTVFYGGNRLGINTNIMEDNTAVLEIHNADEVRKKILFVYALSESRRETCLDITTGQGTGFTFYGTTWD